MLQQKASVIYYLMDYGRTPTKVRKAESQGACIERLESSYSSEIEQRRRTLDVRRHNRYGKESSS